MICFNIFFKILLANSISFLENIMFIKEELLTSLIKSITSLKLQVNQENNIIKNQEKSRKNC